LPNAVFPFPAPHEGAGIRGIGNKGIEREPGMGKIRFVYFDLGNVLLKFSVRRLLHQVSELVERSEEEVRSVLFDEKKYMALESGAITAHEYFAQVLAGFNKNIPTELFLEATNNIFWVNEDILPLIRTLSKSLIPRGVLSNTGPAHWAYTQEAFPCIWNLFPRHRIASFAVKCMKPSEKIYQIAYEEAKTEIRDLQPNEILFLDDLEENIAGAKKFGFEGLVFSEIEPVIKAFTEYGLPVPDED